MSRFKNPHTGTVASALTAYLMQERGLTQEQVAARYGELWDKYGPSRRDKLLSRANNMIVRRAIRKKHTHTWLRHDGVEMCNIQNPNGTCSSVVPLLNAYL